MRLKEHETATYLAFRDEADRVLDFHALRHQFISNLGAAGVHPKFAQTLARHSTITLTLDRYTNVGLYDQSASVNRLPAIPVEVPDSETNSLKATGMEDGPGPEAPTVVPRGAEKRAAQAASPAIRIARQWTAK